MDGVVLVATGAKTGHTFVAGKHQFVNGITVVKGAGAVRYFGRVYKAYPVGSLELERAKEADACNLLLEITNGVAKVLNEPKDKLNGSSEIHSTVGIGRQGQQVSSSVQSSGGESTKIPTADGGRTNDHQAGGTERVSSRGGQSDSGHDGDFPSERGRILKALEALDNKNNEHWTNDGRPRIDAIEAVSGVTGLSRQHIDNVAPEFRRKKDG
jgi:hypothetical protein